MRLFLIRHGQTVWNNDSRAQGHTDVSLDSTGLDQSARLGAAMASLGLEAVLSSDLKRSIQTAEPVAAAARVPLEVDPSLRERTFGDWEGHPYGQVGEKMHSIQAETGLSMFEVRPPNGESMVDVWERLGPVCDRLCAETRTVAVVSHGGAAALLLAKLIQAPIEVSRAFRFANTGLTELARRADGTFYIARYNDTSHLDKEKVLSGDLDLKHN
jgi:probable phosphoglycerate mutase